ncbi:hypothetical protein [Leptospira yasudae]|uniref:Uncharacterized protein n=1 Tax=Leptospira yasudae TaxID=2202201 RepID=A0A6N4QC19_9LEPT|nr:hypothetical protein [Leptospira yasudae]TGL73640.1 hypothetical protein EHQ72_19290 [Leptospira yasudae]TGL80621.1 hypothetical protein EHQ77_07840 [Leptospira yasudae]TGL84269.1 hypothetical protein EHQ83_11310 [Leptospira yasudae]
MERFELFILLSVILTAFIFFANRLKRNANSTGHSDVSDFSGWTNSGSDSLSDFDSGDSGDSGGGDSGGGDGGGGD